MVAAHTSCNVKHKRKHLSLADLVSSPYSNLTTEELCLKVAKERSQPALKLLMDRFDRELSSYLRRYLGSERSVDDVKQWTWLNVWEKAGQFQEGRKFSSWLYVIATNQAIDHQRREKRHKMVSLDQRNCARDENDHDPLIAVLCAKDDSVVQKLLKNEKREAVFLIVRGLKEEQRELVNLAYVQGMSYPDIAKALGIPLSTVKSRLGAIKNTITERLQEAHRSLLAA